MKNLVHDIVKLRICVAFMGEKEQVGWWPSSFLSCSGGAFLSPVFPKTSALARVNGASGAARIVHDEHIGIGDVYHLFRFPESIECDISELLAKDASVLELISSETTAQAGLKVLSTGKNDQGFGPLLIEENLIGDSMIARMAAAYIHGFSSGERVYPYYRSKV
ncbi:BrxE family protein [Porticoccus sp.]|nr:BrxE family protein [Porticoccus sp.]